MLSSGDEIGQLNGYEYHNDPDLKEDSRNLHRTAFKWDNAALRNTPGTVQERLWDGLKQLETIRAEEPSFGAGAYVTTWDSHNNHVLALMRVTSDEKLVGLFNFSGSGQDVRLDQMEGKFTDLITGEELSFSAHSLAPYQYIVCRQKMN